MHIPGLFLFYPAPEWGFHVTWQLAPRYDACLTYDFYIEDLGPFAYYGAV